MKARRDLADIGDWIASDNPRRALSFVRELRARAESLVDWPERFPVSHFDGKGPVRRIPHGRYGIFYRVAGDRVMILRVLHGARSDPDPS